MPGVCTSEGLLREKGYELLKKITDRVVTLKGVTTTEGRHVQMMSAFYSGGAP